MNRKVKTSALLRYVPGHTDMIEILPFLTHFRYGDYNMTNNAYRDKEKIGLYLVLREGCVWV